MVTVSSQCQAIIDRYQRVQSQAERGHVTCLISTISGKLNQITRSLSTKQNEQFQ